MSKPTDKILLIPGESGWEIWTGQPESGFTLHAASLTTRASELTGIPGGDILMFFPVKAVTAIPMRVASVDDSLFPDLTVMHAERLGMRPDPLAGQLTDSFVIAREGDSTALLSIHLRPPAEGDLPVRGPKEFDISARAFPVTGDCLTIWKEFGRWVFSLSYQGKIIYCQATSEGSEIPDESLVREIRLAIIQMSLQGIHLSPTRVILWAQGENPTLGALENGFQHARVEVCPRPSPVLPEPRSKLLPADVRAARRAARRRRNIILASAAILIAYLGVIGWFGYDLWKIQADTKVLRSKAKAAAPDADAYKRHLAKWNELNQALDLNRSPVDILYRISRCIPANSGLRLKTAEITAGEIHLSGEAQQPGAVNQFSLSLTKSNDLVGLTWQTPAPTQSTRGWEFNFTANAPKN